LASIQAPLEQFVKRLEESNRASAPVILWAGEQWGESVLRLFMKWGWPASVHPASSRLEFFQKPRESLDGLFVEALPGAWKSEQIQRFFAAGFSALRPEGVLFFAFRGQEFHAMLAWLRQAGFEALDQGESGEWRAVLARRMLSVTSDRKVAASSSRIE
jgi:hypothetical protein